MSSTPQHAGRVALVTGAGGGIGRQIALDLAGRHGAHVAVLDRDANAADHTVQAITQAGGAATAFVVDLAEHAALQACLARIDSTLAPPAIVINNAAIASTVPAISYPLAQWNLTMAVNVTAPMLICQHTLGGMRQQGWGRIVNIASISGVRAGTGRLGYGTSKAALIALTRQFAIEAAEWGVTVNALAPGFVDTPMLRGLHGSSQSTYEDIVPMRRLCSPQEVADAALFFTTEQTGFITGQILGVDGGFLASGIFVRQLFDIPAADQPAAPRGTF